MDYAKEKLLEHKLNFIKFLKRALIYRTKNTEL